MRATSFAESAPRISSIFFPPLKNWKVGIAWMPQTLAISSASSTSTLTNWTSECSFDKASKIGPIALQGPHLSWKNENKVVRDGAGWAYQKNLMDRDAVTVCVFTGIHRYHRSGKVLRCNDMQRIDMADKISNTLHSPYGREIDHNELALGCFHHFVELIHSFNVCDGHFGNFVCCLLLFVV